MGMKDSLSVSLQFEYIVSFDMYERYEWWKGKICYMYGSTIHPWLHGDKSI